MSDLRRLVAEHDIASRLTEQEQNILRMAAKNKSLQGIASLYGFPNAAAAGAALERIKDKLEGRAPSAPSSTVNRGASRNSSQPTRPVVDSPPPVARPATRSERKSSARERILTWLEAHPESPSSQLIAISGVARASTYSLLSAMRAEGLIRQDDTTKLHVLGNGKPVVPRPKVSKVPSHEDWMARYVDVVALETAIAEKRREAERLADLQRELDQLENLRSALAGIGV